MTDGLWNRRRILGATLALPLAGHAFAAQAPRLTPTARQTAGPFYPEIKPRDADSDLASVAGRNGRAAGELAYLVGRVLDQDGAAIAGARIEIWQCDARGHYHLRGEEVAAGADPNFQGYGAAVSGPDGTYRFRTIKPVPYPGRTPHIHAAVDAPGFPRLVTQIYLAGHAQNERDNVLASVRDPVARAGLMVGFRPAPEIEAGALRGVFDIVLARG